MKKQYLPFALLAFLFFTGTFSCKKGDTVTPKETVLYQTNFSSNDGKWAVGQIPHGGSTYYQNGNYIVVGGNDINTFSYSYIANLFTGISGDIAIQASIKPVVSSGKGQIGLLWDFQSEGGQNSSYYLFEISHGGQWGIFQYQLTDPTNDLWTITTVVGWTVSSTMQADQFNNLQIKQSKGQLLFSINGAQVYKMNTTGSTLDQAGLFADVNSELEANLFEAVDWQ